MNNEMQQKTAAPEYLRLYHRIREGIESGTYPSGTKLPSKRTMAAESGLSTVTVEHAYALLTDEGYIEPRVRSGYFVIFRAQDGFMRSPGIQILPHHPHRAAAPLGFSYSLLTKTMRRVMSDYGETLLENSPNSGREELKTALMNYLSRSRGINISTEQIVIGSGAEYLYGLIVELLGRKRKFAIESPSYRKIELVYRAADVDIDMLPLGSDGIESTALRETAASVLHISPYRSFPSGVTATASKRHEYLAWARFPERYIVEDDFESEFSVLKKPEETLFSRTNDDNVIYMNTFSKTISPSLRVAYMVLPRRLVAEFDEKLGFYSCTVPTFEQLVLTELIANGDFERHINRVRREMRKALAARE